MDRRLPRAEENNLAENTEVEENEEEQTTPVPLISAPLRPNGAAVPRGSTALTWLGVRSGRNCRVRHERPFARLRSTPKSNTVPAVRIAQTVAYVCRF